MHASKLRHKPFCPENKSKFKISDKKSQKIIKSVEFGQASGVAKIGSFVYNIVEGNVIPLYLMRYISALNENVIKQCFTAISENVKRGVSQP